MKAWQLWPLAAWVVVTASYGMSECKPSDNASPCKIGVGAVKAKRMSTERCLVFLQNPIKQFWVGFSQRTTVTWELGKSVDAAFKLVGIEFDVPSAFALVSSSDRSMTFNITDQATAGTDYKYTLKVAADSAACEIDPWVRNQ